MTKTEEKLLLTYAQNRTIGLPAIGVYVYLLSREGDVFSYDEAEKEVGISPNTLKKYIKQLESLHIAERNVARRGLIITICPTNLWAPRGPNMYTTNINIYKETIGDIIQDLNIISGRQFKETNQNTRELIVARLKEGRTLEDFKKVHQNKKDWVDSAKMAQYYRPHTLYRKNKFSVYLEDQAVTGPKRLKTTSNWNTDEAKEKMAQQKAKLRKEFGGE